MDRPFNPLSDGQIKYLSIPTEKSQKWKPKNYQNNSKKLKPIYTNCAGESDYTGNPYG